MLKIILRIAVLLLAGALIGAWWFDLPARFGWTAQAEAPLELYGNVEIRQVDLSFRVAGRIASMPFEEGEAVEAGTAIARLETQPFDDEIRAAKAQVAAMEATLAKLIAGPRPEEIDQARAELGVRKAEFKNTQQDLRRARQLQKSGAITPSRLDQLQSAQDMAEAQLAAAQANLNLLEEGSREEDIAAARANLAGAKAALAAAETELSDTHLKAPADGEILTRVREPGAIVASGQPVYVLSLSDDLWVRAYVSEPDLGRIHPGMEVEVVTDTRPKRPYHGHVGFISPVAEFTPKSVETPELRTDLVYRFRVIIDEKDTALRQGMPVTVRIPRADTTKQD